MTECVNPTRVETTIREMKAAKRIYEVHAAQLSEFSAEHAATFRGVATGIQLGIAQLSYLLVPEEIAREVQESLDAPPGGGGDAEAPVRGGGG